MILCYIKLKEFKNARALSLENIKKLKEQTIFGLNNDEGVPFSLKYMSSVCCVSLYLESSSKHRNEMKKSKNQALIELYKLQKENANFKEQSDQLAPSSAASSNTLEYIKRL